MRTVEASTFVPASAVRVETFLTPETVVEAEGTFAVVDVAGDPPVVTGRASGMTATFAFEERSDGYEYAQQGSAGPFEAMETTLTWAGRDDGTTVTARSSVSLGLPLASLTDRVAAWKRRGELKRLLARVEAEFE
ncbi:SRPBCC family protein [Haloarcula salina]|uniref:SRPBCC family protein n=1 Tax=Haloarcula salina TaxID=1429914 RepID=A0AA41G2D1_9EURY|nr:SRPBCC family protein [Haloarcula salina]MBV0902221.1 SRPBCC family protein [Haloarcula salina]